MAYTEYDQENGDRSILTWRVFANHDMDNADIERLVLDSASTHLNLDDTGINDNNAKALALSSTITTLELWRNDITDEGAKALALNTTLRSLHLGNGRIGDGGAKAFGVNTTLMYLSIWRNKIGDDGTKALALNTTLTHLDLDYNNISDEGAKALYLNTTLISLNLNVTRVSHEWKAKVQNRIEINKREMCIRRDQFIRCLIMLTRDSVNCKSNSSWSHLPGDMRRYIIDRACRHWNLGLSYIEARSCASYIFENITHLIESIRECKSLRVTKRNNIAVIETIG